MSYVDVSRDGAHSFGHTVYRGFTDDDHPVRRVAKWNKTEDGQREGRTRTCVLLSFQEVPDDTPDADELSPRIF